MINNKEVFDNVKELLSQNIPELGKFLTHWEEPFSISKNQTIILPDKSSVTNNKVNFTIRFIISTLEKSADLIPYTQMDLVHKITSLVYSGLFPYVLLGKEEIYLDPIPQAPLVGVIDMTISMVIDYIDDCDI